MSRREWNGKRRIPCGWIELLYRNLEEKKTNEPKKIGYIKRDSKQKDNKRDCNVEVINGRY